jgi:hypothetical protein
VKAFKTETLSIDAMLSFHWVNGSTEEKSNHIFLGDLYYYPHDVIVMYVKETSQLVFDVEQQSTLENLCKTPS